MTTNLQVHEELSNILDFLETTETGQRITKAVKLDITMQELKEFTPEELQMVIKLNLLLKYFTEKACR